MNQKIRDANFLISSLILILTIYFSIATFLDWFDFGYFVGPYRLNHWFGWSGFLFISINVPLFTTLKRRYAKKIRLLLGLHVLGNLTAFLLISIHFAAQISRPAQFYPDLGTGLALYIIMPILVTTGFLQRFNLLSKYRKKWRFLHTSLVGSLFIIILVHILHGIGLI
jgi:hypothetical protein